MGVRTSFRQGLLCAAAIITTMAMPADTLALEPAEFTIEAAPLGDALRAFSQQSGRAILFSEGTVSGLTAPRLNGTYEPEAALTLLLQGTGLEFTQGPNGNLIVRRQTGADPVQTPEAGRGRGREVQGEPDPETDSRRIETITVTGTSIRGIAPESSPLFVFDREEILSSGLSTTEQFMRALPQNFGGGSSEFVPSGLPNDRNASSNDTAGTSANLRGLGSRGTLVLLNGNRTAPSSRIGDFVDVSLIPMTAIERVEVLSDGASSIYGADAVAGVVNFVLRDDYDGAETSLRLGTTTRGGVDEVRIGQTLGRSWTSGNVLAAYEYYDRSRLSLADRPGIDLFASSSAAIELPDRELFSLMPQQERHSGVIAASYAPNAQLRFDTTSLFSRRTSSDTSFAQTGFLYDRSSESENLTTALAADYEFAQGWFAVIAANYSQVRNDSQISIIARPDGGPLQTQADRTRSELWSVDGKIDGELFALPGGDVKAAIGGHFREESFRQEIPGTRIVATGTRNVQAGYAEVLLPLIGDHTDHLPIQYVHLNVSGRAERYSDFGTRTTPKVGVVWALNDDFRMRGSYSTSFAPPALGLAFSTNRSGLVLPYRIHLGPLAPPDPSLAAMDMLQLTGVSGDLSAETSRTFTFGFDANAELGRHHWSTEGTYYNIRFEDRLGAIPVPSNLTVRHISLLAWDDSSLFPTGAVTFFPTQQQIQTELAALQQPLVVVPGSSLENIGVIFAATMTRNLALTETSGVDLNLRYSTQTNWGDISAGVNANYIIDFIDQASSSTPAVSTLNSLYKPVDLQLRAHIGLSSGAYALNVAANHVSAYRTDLTDNAARIAPWTTFDANLTYRFASSSPVLAGLSLHLSAINIFDQDPPSTPPFAGNLLTGFDPTNASPLGRFLAVEIRKAF